MEKFRQIVVWFDLGGVGVPVQAEAGDEFLREGLPVDFGVGDQVGVV